MRRHLHYLASYVYMSTFFEVWAKSQDLQVDGSLRKDYITTGSKLLGILTILFCQLVAETFIKEYM